MPQLVLFDQSESSHLVLTFIIALFVREPDAYKPHDDAEQKDRKIICRTHTSTCPCHQIHLLEETFNSMQAAQNSVFERHHYSYYLVATRMLSKPILSSFSQSFACSPYLADPTCCARCTYHGHGLSYRRRSSPGPEYPFPSPHNRYDISVLTLGMHVRI